MITTGSKLFYGLGSLATISSIVWFIANDGMSMGFVTLIFLAITLFFLGAISSFVRDGHVLSSDISAHATAAAGQGGLVNSWFPFGSAVALGMVVIGLVHSPGIFKVGICLFFAMLGEWMIQNWSGRASANDSYNEKVRRWVVHPLEIPIGGALLLTVVVLSFSRVMLSISREAGPIAFAMAGSLILIGGSVVSVRRGANKKIIGALCGGVLVVVSGVGVAMALKGERHELTVAASEDHFSHRPCGLETEVPDEDASRSVGAKSSVAATITLKDGLLTAEMDGFPTPMTAISLQRSYNTMILFRNEDAGEHRMVLAYGKTVEDLGGGVQREKLLEACTSLISQGGQQALHIRLPKPSFSSAEPFTIFVPGIEGAVIKVTVP